MEWPKICAYENTKFAPCDGEIIYKVSNYWRGEALKKFGPDMFLCKKHGIWWSSEHPFGPPVVRIKK